MTLHAKIQKWGDGLALRIGGAMREIPQFKEGTEAEPPIMNKVLYRIIPLIGADRLFQESE